MIMFLKFKNGTDVVSEVLSETTKEYKLKNPYVISLLENEEGNAGWNLLPLTSLSKHGIVNVDKSNLILNAYEVSQPLEDYYIQCVKIGNETEIPKLNYRIDMLAKSMRYKDEIINEMFVFKSSDTEEEIIEKMDKLNLFNMPVISVSLN